MWSYYGSKSRVINLYPTPKEDMIIEPFAGSARYSLKYFEKDVLLVDKYSVIIEIWEWLQLCSPNDVLKLPLLKKGESLANVSLSKPEKYFLGMMAGIASTSPRNKISAFSAEQNGRKNYLKRIASQLYKIKHWKFKCDCYTSIRNQRATWFIDPPYMVGGHAYVHNQINYQSLKEWSISRMGQIIVCENMSANWMNFSPLTQMRGANRKYTTEAIWTNQPSAFDYQQQKLF